MSALAQAARRLRDVLRRETDSARRAALPDLATLMEEKQEAIDALEAAGLPATEAEFTALREMMVAAEENALVLATIAGTLEEVQTRLRRDLAEAADPGIYGPGTRGRRPPRHTLAASFDQTA